MSTASAFLLVDDERKAQLDLLNKIDASAAADICKAALGYLSTGLNTKSIASAANHLQLDVDTVRTTIDSLLWLYTECAKTKISNEALDESLKLLGFNASIRQSFIECYSSKANLLQKTLATDLALSLPRYKNLNWRFDVQIASKNFRSRNQFDPYFLLKLTLTNGNDGQEQVHVLQIDPLTLVHIVGQLESAMNELTNNHARRIMQTFR